MYIISFHSKILAWKIVSDAIIVKKYSPLACWSSRVRVSFSCNVFHALGPESIQKNKERKRYKKISRVRKLYTRFIQNHHLLLVSYLFTSKLSLYPLSICKKLLCFSKNLDSRSSFSCVRFEVWPLPAILLCSLASIVPSSVLKFYYIHNAVCICSSKTDWTKNRCLWYSKLPNASFIPQIYKEKHCGY